VGAKHNMIGTIVNRKLHYGRACHSFHCWHSGVRAVEVDDAGNKSCHKLQQVLQVLHILLEELQPIMDHFVHQVSQSNHGNAFTNSWSAMNIWFDNLKGTFKSAEMEVNNCIK
jgi:hypothetical protein